MKLIRGSIKSPIQSRASIKEYYLYFKQDQTR